MSEALTFKEVVVSYHAGKETCCAPQASHDRNIRRIATNLIGKMMVYIMNGWREKHKVGCNINENV